MGSPSLNIANLDRGGWKILPGVKDTLPVQSSDNFYGGDRRFAEPGPGLTPANEIESSESKNQAVRAENETTGGNFSNRRLRDETAGKFDRNSLGSISSRK